MADSLSAPPAGHLAPPAVVEPAALTEFVALCGAPAWRKRITALARPDAAGTRSARALQQRYTIELTLARLMVQPAAPLTALDLRLASLAAGLVALADRLTQAGRQCLCTRLRDSVTGPGSLVPIFHLAWTEALQSRRGFDVHHAGLADAAPFDLLLCRDGMEAELSCETVSAEDGRDLHRSAWFNLVDGIDPDLQTWLSAHPGRYLLKMTLPQGLRTGADGAPGLDQLAELQRRIRDMLSRQRRSDHDEAAVLRLDPLLLAGAQAGDMGMMDALRTQFGPEAQLAVTRSGKGVFVMAARAGRENDIGAAVRRRMADATPLRFTGTRPGILAMFLEDTDRAEWRSLRDGMMLEGEARRYLTGADAARLVAVTATSRAELFSASSDDCDEVRYRNQAHRDAKSPALAPAVTSSF